MPLYTLPIIPDNNRDEFCCSHGSGHGGQEKLREIARESEISLTPSHVSRTSDMMMMSS